MSEMQENYHSAVVEVAEESNFSFYCYKNDTCFKIFNFSRHPENRNISNGVLLCVLSH